MKLLHPGVVRDHSDGVTARHGNLVGTEEASHHGPHLEDVEEVGAHHKPEAALGLVLPPPGEAGDEDRSGPMPVKLRA